VPFGLTTPVFLPAGAYPLGVSVFMLTVSHRFERNELYRLSGGA
jgi:hypothetical protein